MNICVQVFYAHVFSFLLDIFFIVELLDSVVTLCLIFWGTELEHFYSIEFYSTFASLKNEYTSSILNCWQPSTFYP